MGAFISIILPASLAFTLAVYSTGIEYRKTENLKVLNFALNYWVLYLYLTFYGIIALVFFFVLMKLITIEGLDYHSDATYSNFTKAAIAGFTTKAFLNANIFPITINEKPSAFTLEKLFEPVEKGLKKLIADQCYIRYSEFIEKYEKQFLNIELNLFKEMVYKELCKLNIGRPDDEKVKVLAYLSDFVKLQSHRDCISSVYLTFGSKVFTFIFTNLLEDLPEKH